MYSFTILGFLFVCASLVDRLSAIDIAGCGSYNSKVVCHPVSPSIPQFIGARISGYDIFQVYYSWTLSTFPYKTFANFKGIRQMYLYSAGLRFLRCDTFISMKDSLEYLNLFNNILTEIEQCTFRNLSSLTGLDLRSNEIERLNEFSLYTLDKLASIHLSGNSLSEISENTFGMRNKGTLKFIGLQNNKISNVHKHAFDKHTNLERLHLNNNRLNSDIWKSLNLFKLKTLNLAHNRIETVDSSVLNLLGKLKDLDLSHNLIKTLHGVYLRSGVMSHISIAYNTIGSIHAELLSPTNTFSNTSSVTIDFSNNNLKSLHINLPGCEDPVFCIVYLQNNVLSGLTFSYNGETKVYIINVERNNLTKLPDSFPFATYQHLSNNPLLSKSAVNFLQTKLKYTKYLYMSNISLFCFEQRHEIEYTRGINMSSIKLIDLSNNCIQDEFVCLLSLASRILELRLDFNDLKSFPKCIVGIPRELNISVRYNNITHFNFSVDLSSIFDINLEGNLIKEIPSTLRQIQSVTLKNNQLSNFGNLMVWLRPRNFKYCSIDLSNNSIQAIESINIKYAKHFIFGNCYKINLDLSSNSLTVFPNTSFDLHQFFLPYLDTLTIALENNSLTNVKTVGFQISGNMINAIRFYYMGNNIEEISEPICLVSGEIGNDIGMYIDLSYNRLSSHPSCDNLIVNSSYMYIDTVSLSHNRLTIMPGLDNTDYCYMYTNNLYLSGNKIKRIQSVIGGKIVNSRPFTVNSLIARNNDMEFITDMAFGKLVNLRNLDLSSNLLTALPEELNALSQLDSLDVSNNNIIHFTYKPSLSRKNELYPRKIYLKNNPIYCSCSIAWLRDSHRITDNARCSSPMDKKGYHIACFPINECNNTLSTRPGKQTLNRCSSEEGMFGIQIDIKTRVLNDKLIVSWISYRPYNIHKFQVISKKKGEELSRILLNSEETTYSLMDVHAEEICVFAVNDSFAPLFGKCLNLLMGLKTDPTLLKTHSDINCTCVECTSGNCSDITVLTIILATVAALSVGGNLTLVIMKCRKNINKKRTTEEKKRKVEKERVSADNNVELDDIDKQNKTKKAAVYEKIKRPESVEFPIYEELNQQ